MNSLTQSTTNTLKILILAIILAVGMSYAFADWSAPTAVPPGANAPAPVNVSSVGQIKDGGLTLNTTGATNGLLILTGKVGIGMSNPTEKLDVAGKVKGIELCIGSDCRSAWPTSSTGTPPPPVTTGIVVGGGLGSPFSDHSTPGCSGGGVPFTPEQSCVPYGAASCDFANNLVCPAGSTKRSVGNHVGIGCTVATGPDGSGSNLVVKTKSVYICVKN